MDDDWHAPFAHPSGTNVVLRTVRRVHFLMFIPVIVGIKYYYAFFKTDDIARRSVQVVIFVVIII